MSEYSLDGLIAKVKSEAIERAEKEAKEIVENAKSEAQRILKKAETEKQQLLNEAESQAQDIKTKGEIALKQAAREVSVATKNDLLALFQGVLQAEIKSSFKPELYQTIVQELVASLGDNLAITLPTELGDQVVKDIHQKVITANTDVQLTSSNQLFSGLTVSKSNEGWTYNITAEEVAELINQQLSKKYMEIINKA